MFERFTDRCRRVLVLAQEEARLLGHDVIGTEHFLLALIHEGDGIAAQALDSLGVSLTGARAQVQELRPPLEGRAGGSLPFTARAKNVLELSLREALQLGHNHIGTEHMLLGLVREGEGRGIQALAALHVTARAVREAVMRLLSGDSPSSDAAVAADQVERIGLPFDPAALLTEDEAAELIHGWLVVDSNVEQAVLEDITYATVVHRAAPPQILVTVVGARVTRASFDRSSALIGDAEPVEGVGDAAAYSPRRRSLRVLSGESVFVVRVDNHPHPKAAATAVAVKAVAHLGRS